ncbi:MAG: hypothetical protein NTY57_07670 [Solirubrobacterales bacterium]|nr:hypothetical protein [Solirubrobacterales bacterium]
MRRSLTTIAVISGTLAISGCGGSTSGSNQSHADGTFRVSTPGISFPVSQHINKEAVLKIPVRNLGTRPIPDVTITLTTGTSGTSAPAFSNVDSQPGLAEHWKHVWFLDLPPANGDTALANSWSLGEVAPGATATFTWHVHPSITGPHLLNWKISPAMLGGQAVLVNGAPATGSFQVVIKSKAPSATVRSDGTVAKDYTPASTRKTSPAKP